MYHNVEVEDIASATILFENGAHGILQVGIVDPISTTRLEICDEKGKLICENGKARRAILGKPVREYAEVPEVWEWRPEIRWVDVKPKVEEGRGHGAVTKDFAQAILEDREPQVNGEEGGASLEIVNAIILSSFEGKAVSFPIDRDAYDRLMRKLSQTN